MKVLILGVNGFIGHHLCWRPRIGMPDALKRVFDAYRTHMADARQLVRESAYIA